MAVRKFFLCIGQSNAAPTATGQSWKDAHPSLVLQGTPSYVTGTYQPTVTLPWAWPGYGASTAPSYSASVNIAGKAISSVRLWTSYNPAATGYVAFPGTARVQTGSTTTSIITDVRLATSVVGMTITRKNTNTTHTVTGTTTTGGFGVLTLSGSTPFTSSPAVGEEIRLQIKATAAVSSGGTTVDTHVIWGSTLGPASAYRASLVGLELKYLGPTHANQIGVRKKITGVAANGTTLTFESAWQQDPSASDLFEIAAPQVAGADVPLQKWGLFLPWSPFEGEVSNAAAQPSGKSNPYPPGFNYPSQWTLLPIYNAFDGNSLLLNASDSVSAAVGLGVQLSQRLGEDIYCVHLAAGSTSLAVQQFYTDSLFDVGWYDLNQQANWSPTQQGSLHYRLLDMLDGAKLTAQAQGDTLECVGVFVLQGESDANSFPTFSSYADNLRAWKTAVRNAIVAKGLYAGAAATIPWIHPHVLVSSVNAEFINTAITDVARGDSYMDTFVTDSFIKQDSFHYNGFGLAQVEEAMADKWLPALAGNAGWVDVVTTETGTGSSTADSYVTEAFCDDYFSAQNLVTTWLNATAKNKQAAMRYATSWVDNHYGLQFVGLKTSSTQALEWPRSFAYDRDGYPITGIPTALKKATAEVARRWLEDATQLDPDIAAGSNVTQDTVTVGPITISKSYAGGKDAEKRVKVVDRMFQVGGLIESGGWAKR